MLASRLSINEVLPFTNLLGIVLIFLGVQQAAKARRPQTQSTSAAG